MTSHATACAARSIRSMELMRCASQVALSRALITSDVKIFIRAFLFECAKITNYFCLRKTGRFGDPSKTDRLSPVKIASGIRSVAAGDYHSCGLPTAVTSSSLARW